VTGGGVTRPTEVPDRLTESETTAAPPTRPEHSRETPAQPRPRRWRLLLALVGAWILVALGIGWGRLAAPPLPQEAPPTRSPPALNLAMLEADLELATETLRALLPPSSPFHRIPIGTAGNRTTMPPTPEALIQALRAEDFPRLVDALRARLASWTEALEQHPTRSIFDSSARAFLEGLRLQELPQLCPSLILLAATQSERVQAGVLAATAAGLDPGDPLAAEVDRETAQAALWKLRQLLRQILDALDAASGRRPLWALTLVGELRTAGFYPFPFPISRHRRADQAPPPPEVWRGDHHRVLHPSPARRAPALALPSLDDALRAIAAGARGDARRALDVLELSAEHARSAGGEVDLAAVEEALAQKTLLYDKTGEEHYNVVSAFIKSMRGNDPDAAVYWMMRMLEAGDDPLFVLRRLIIFASEDVGNADPRALGVAVDADQAFRRLGMPEGLMAMAQACTYLASAPKSNASYRAWVAARKDVEEHGALPVPLKLRNAATDAMKSWGYGGGYRYPHDEGGHSAGETYLPDALVGTRFYEPKESGFEIKIRDRLARLRGEDTDE